MHFLDSQKRRFEAAKVQLVVVHHVGSKHLFTRRLFFPSSAGMNGVHGGASTEWVWPRRTNLWAFWHYAAQPWGQRKALSSPTQWADLSLAPWEHRWIMGSRAPGITFGFTRVESILEPQQKGGSLWGGTGVPRTCHAEWRRCISTPAGLTVLGGGIVSQKGNVSVKTELNKPSFSVRNRKNVQLLRETFHLQSC